MNENELTFVSAISYNIEAGHDYDAESNTLSYQLLAQCSNKWQQAAMSRGKRLCERLGLNWKDVNVFVKLPEKGRAMAKQAGFNSLGSIG